MDLSVVIIQSVGLQKTDGANDDLVECCYFDGFDCPRKDLDDLPSDPIHLLGGGGARPALNPTPFVGAHLIRFALCVGCLYGCLESTIMAAVRSYCCL